MRYFILLLLIAISCSLPDPGVRAYTFDTEYKPLSTIIDGAGCKYYKIIVFESCDGTNWMNVDTLKIKSETVYINVPRGTNKY